MAGREFGPPPSRVEGFEISWRNWLYLVFQKIYKRTYNISLQTYNSVEPSTNSMSSGLVGLAPVILADDTTSESRNLSFELPENWVQGTDLIVSVRFINTTVQTGVVTVITQLSYLSVAATEVIAGSTVLSTTTTLTNNVVADTLHVTANLIIPSSALTIGDSIFLQLARDIADTCVGDVAYQVVVVNYDGFINHE